MREMIYSYKRGRLFRVIVIVLGILLVLWLGLLACVATMAKRMDAPLRSDVMIVLGGGIDEQGRPRSTLKYRLDRAKELYSQGYAPRMIVCGGQGSDEPISEAEAMRTYLVEAGVPADVIMIEDASTDTVENLRYARRIMDEHAFDTALVVTSDYHLWRALKIAEDAGISASGAGARNSSSAFYILKNLARETFSWLKYMVQS